MTAVTVVIPHLDDVERLAGCLERLERQTLAAGYEVLVVDNGSERDPAPVVARFPHAELLREPRRSSYAARNRAVGRARGEVLAFTDSDCRPAFDWLERGLERVAAQAGPAFVAGRIDVFTRPGRRPALAERYELLHAFPQRRFVEEMGFGATANLFVRRDAFLRAGPFGDALISGGDREWCVRAGAAGLAAVYADEVAIEHPARESAAAIARKARRVKAGEAQLRALEGRRLGVRGVLRPFVRPPVRAIRANLRGVEPPTLRAKASYAAFALGVFYLAAAEQLRLSARAAA
jgi:GT2 family glycosyltransferase